MPPAKASPRITVVIADDHHVVVDGIALAMKPYFDIVGECYRLEEVLPALRRADPDVIVLDISFGDKSSLSLLQQATQVERVRTRFLMLTAHDSESLERSAFTAGATGFLRKGASAQDLRWAIQAVAEGRRYPPPVPGQKKRVKVTTFRPPATRALGGFMLTPLQLDVMQALSKEPTRAKAAQRIHLSIKGFDYHVTALKALTGIVRTFDLLRWYEEAQREKVARGE